MYGDGTNFREWFYVTDHVSAIMRVLNNNSFGERNVYNIAGESFSNIELIFRILSIMGKPRDLISFVSDRKGHDFRYSVDDSLIKSKLDWRPLIGLDQGLMDTINWYTRNGAWTAYSESQVLL